MRLRRKAREIALQVLYQIDVLNIDAEEGVDLFWSHFSAQSRPVHTPRNSSRGPAPTGMKSTCLISTCSENWSLERMARVDRNILGSPSTSFYTAGNPPESDPQRSD